MAITIQQQPTTPNMSNIGEAIAQYESTLLAGNSRFDQWYFDKDENALTEQEIKGFKLFMGKARCSSCHLVSSDHALFTDQQLHNTGIGYEDSMLKDDALVQVILAPGVIGSISQSRINSVGNRRINDLGHYEVSQNPKDRWKFRTTNLRNVELTAPYMHSGEFPTLRDVVNFYNNGGIKHELLSPLISPLNLSDIESQQIVAFLKSLTGDNVRTLVADAFAAGIGDTGAK